MKLNTTAFARGAVLDVRQDGNRFSVACKNPAGSSNPAYDIVINAGEEASTVRGRNEVGEPVDYLVVFGPGGITVTDELVPGKMVSYATPKNYALETRDAQQSLAVNVISSLIGVPLAFDPSQLA